MPIGWKHYDQQKMRSRTVRIVLMIQAVGLGAAFAATLIEDPPLWLLSLFPLLPGSLVTIPISKLITPGFALLRIRRNDHDWPSAPCGLAHPAR
jgi:hypothetical protein